MPIGVAAIMRKLVQASAPRRSDVCRSYDGTTALHAGRRLHEGTTRAYKQAGTIERCPGQTWKGKPP